MTLNQQLHKSATHKPGNDPACPACQAKPTYGQVLRYARGAVRTEYTDPLHRGHYDNQSVLDDVLNHFKGLTVEDDEDLIRDAVREAEQSEYPEEAL